jgi:phenylalanyl-tRNA synthetase beta chain
MKLSEAWLRSLLKTDVDQTTLLNQLTMAGLEVDGVEPAAPAFHHVVVGEVLEAVQHPDADKLRVTKVNVGQAEPLTIVCGAPNARAGLKVACAMVGAVLPGDFKIKPAKLRGQDSFGMLCSPTELGMEASADGIWELPADAPVGMNLRDYLGLDDTIIEVSLTPNRADCFSLRGLARDMGVMLGAQTCESDYPDFDFTDATVQPVSIQDTQAVPRYAGAVIKGVNAKAATPLWMTERLRRSGLRSLNPIVDVTNYVMLELGQPMHAFDLNKLSGGVSARWAKADEPLTLLDGKEVKLDAQTLVIADEAGVIAMAGIMGGERTAVDADTQDIFLEAAFFEPMAIVGRARRYGLHTDSSMRFERGVDFELPKQAMTMAMAWILAICGGQASPIQMQESLSDLPQRARVHLRPAKLQSLLGFMPPQEVVTRILTDLGLRPEVSTEGWSVQVPSYRFDIAIEEDLVEEVARIYGYDNLPVQFVQAAMRLNAQPETRQPLSRLKTRLCEAGYQEIITYSFVDPKFQAALDMGLMAVDVQNPISADLGQMRTSLLPGLLSTYASNANRQQTDLRLFETGLRFVLTDADANTPLMERMVQTPLIGGLMAGQTLSQWNQTARSVDFYDLKGDVEALLALTGETPRFVASAQPFLHPGQSADVFLGEVCIGWMGQLHPVTAEALDLPTGLFVFQLEQAPLLHKDMPSYSAVSRFTLNRRDLALVVKADQTYGEIEQAISSAACAHLKAFELFDVYQGLGIDEGERSLAIGFEFQSLDKTLSDEEIQSDLDKILDAIGRVCDYKIRGES